MSYISLPFSLVRKEKIKLDLPKNYSASQYIKRLLYISKKDLNIQNSIIDIVNNRYDLKFFLLATSDFGRNIQENINAVVSDEKFNQAVVHRALDQKNKGVFESPMPLSVMFKDAKKFNIQNPIIGNLLSQVDANKISDAKVKELLSQAKDEELQTRLDRLKKRIDKSDDNNNNNINFDGNDDSNKMVENYIADSIISDIIMTKNYFVDTMISGHQYQITVKKKNYFEDIIILESFCFKIYHHHCLFC